MTQKELAKELKKKFDLTYQIKGWNVHIKSKKDISDNILDFICHINEKSNLGYKRFFKKQKDNYTLIGSVPFGVAIKIKVCT